MNVTFHAQYSPYAVSVSRQWNKMDFMLSTDNNRVNMLDLWHYADTAFGSSSSYHKDTKATKNISTFLILFALFQRRSCQFSASYKYFGKQTFNYSLYKNLWLPRNCSLQWTCRKKGPHSTWGSSIYVTLTYYWCQCFLSCYNEVLTLSHACYIIVPLHHKKLTVVDVKAEVVVCRWRWFVVGCFTRGVPSLCCGGIVTLNVGWLVGADVGNVSDEVMTTFTGPTDCCWCWDGSGSGSGSGSGCDTDVAAATFGSCKLPGESADPPSRENTDAAAAWQTETGMVCKRESHKMYKVLYKGPRIYIIINQCTNLQIVLKIWYEKYNSIENNYCYKTPVLLHGTSNSKHFSTLSFFLNTFLPTPHTAPPHEHKKLNHWLPLLWVQYDESVLLSKAISWLM
jgi:hypothetical protein